VKTRLVVFAVACLAAAAASAQTSPAPLPSPPPRIFPRPGNFFAPPPGPGIFSLVDEARGRTRDAAPRSGYPAFAIMAPGFFDADFRYLDGVPSADRRPFERLKRVRLGEDWTFSTGGAAWARLQVEEHSRLTSTDQTYGLGRVRAYADLSYGDSVRVFGEVLTAGRWGGDLPALPIDSNHADLLNAFADVKLFEVDGHAAYVRVGRQEMLLGSQRLVSALPWANMRRNFDGVRVFRQGERVDVDAFWLEPVVPSRTGFDLPSHDVQLAGAWLTYRPRAGHFVDVYGLYANNDATAVQQGIAVAPSRSGTFGSRYAGDRNGFLWDVEGAVQAGRRAPGEDLLAGMATVGAGRRFTGVPTSPIVWVYYDHASGDADPADARVSTFDHLFPFGHYYLGWADLAARQNNRDLNVHVIAYPAPWVTVWAQYHHLWLDQAADALYNAGGVAFRRDATGAAGTNVGDDVDLVVNLHVDAQSDVMLAYAQAMGGSFLDATAGANASSTRGLYLIYNYRW
jgi:hypothetical protein